MTAQQRAGILTQTLHRDALEQILPRRGPIETTDDVHRGGFARPRRPHDRHELARRNLKGHILQRPHLGLAGAIHTRDVAKGHQRGGHLVGLGDLIGDDGVTLGQSLTRDDRHPPIIRANLHRHLDRRAITQDPD